MKNKLRIRKILFDKPKLVILAFNGKTHNNKVIEIEYEGFEGEGTKSDWDKYGEIKLFNKKDRQKILKQLEIVTNGKIFRKEHLTKDN